MFVTTFQCLNDSELKWDARNLASILGSIYTSCVPQSNCIDNVWSGTCVYLWYNRDVSGLQFGEIPEPVEYLWYPSASLCTVATPDQG